MTSWKDDSRSKELNLDSIALFPVGNPADRLPSTNIEVPDLASMMFQSSYGRQSLPDPHSLKRKYHKNLLGEEKPRMYYKSTQIQDQIREDQSKF